MPDGVSGRCRRACVLVEDHRLVHQTVELAEEFVYFVKRRFFFDQLGDMLAKTGRHCAVDEDFALHGFCPRSRNRLTSSRDDRPAAGTRRHNSWGCCRSFAWRHSLFPLAPGRFCAIGGAFGWNSRGGSGVTLVKIRTFKLDPCFEKRFKQRSKTVRLFDRGRANTRRALPFAQTLLVQRRRPSSARSRAVRVPAAARRRRCRMTQLSLEAAH